MYYIMFLLKIYTNIVYFWWKRVERFLEQTEQLFPDYFCSFVWLFALKKTKRNGSTFD